MAGLACTPTGYIFCVYMCILLSFFYTSQEHTKTHHKSGEDEEREEEETEEEEAEKLKKARDWDEFKDGEMINVQK